MIVGYLSLFGSAFLAATILPFYSEVLLFVLLRQGGDPVWLVATATLGNTLGAVVNWVLGRYLLHFRDRRWFYFSRDQIDKAQRWFQRFGYWTLLLAWMPVGGDAPARRGHGAHGILASLGPVLVSRLCRPGLAAQRAPAPAGRQPPHRRLRLAVPVSPQPHRAVRGGPRRRGAGR